MRRLALLGILLAAGTTAASWVGMSNVLGNPSQDDRQLNSSRRRQNLNEGEVVIWAPNMADSGVHAANLPPAHASARPAPAYVQPPPRQSYYEATRTLLPMAKALGPPRRGEWRGQVQEPEQDYSQFLADARYANGALVVQPVGDLPADQKHAVGHMLDAIEAFFGLPARCAQPIVLSELAPHSFKFLEGQRKINAEAFMSMTLKHSIRNGTTSIVALTDLDLYPGDAWSYDSAFGWSSFHDGTAIISSYRTLDRSPANKARNLLRLTKLSIHELCHTFGLKHCAKYNCLMNGCGNLRESDSKPLILCPDCLAKISLVTGRDPALHLEDMLGLCKAKGFTYEAKHYQKALRTIQ